MLHWEKCQNSLIEKVKKIKNAVWSGDGCFDSMGHSAKYGVYSMFCNSIGKIVHFEIRQVSNLSPIMQICPMSCYKYTTS